MNRNLKYQVSLQSAIIKGTYYVELESEANEKHQYIVVQNPNSLLVNFVMPYEYL